MRRGLGLEQLLPAHAGMNRFTTTWNGATHNGLKASGERIATSKLTEDDVYEIRKRRAGGETLGRIASDFGVSMSNIGYIVRRKTWDHLPPAPAELAPRPGASKLTDTDVYEIRERYCEGEKRHDLAAEYGLTTPEITSIVRRKTWKHLPVAVVESASETEKERAWTRPRTPPRSAAEGSF